MPYLYLSIAIIMEVTATVILKSTKSFTVLIPSIIVIMSYCGSFYFLSKALKVIPVGTAYAIWGGMGIVLTSIFAAILYKQIPNLISIIGILLILSGVIILNLYSKINIH